MYRNIDVAKGTGMGTCMILVRFDTETFLQLRSTLHIVNASQTKLGI